MFNLKTFAVLGLMAATNVFSQGYEVRETYEFTTQGEYLLCEDEISYYQIYGYKDGNISLQEGNTEKKNQGIAQLAKPFTVSEVSMKGPIVEFTAEGLIEKLSGKELVYRMKIDLSVLEMELYAKKSKKTYVLKCTEGED